MFRTRFVTYRIDDGYMRGMQSDASRYPARDLRVSKSASQERITRVINNIIYNCKGRWRNRFASSPQPPYYKSQSCLIRYSFQRSSQLSRATRQARLSFSLFFSHPRRPLVIAHCTEKFACHLFITGRRAYLFAFHPNLRFGKDTRFARVSLARTRCTTRCVNFPHTSWGPHYVITSLRRYVVTSLRHCGTLRRDAIYDTAVRFCYPSHEESDQRESYCG